MNTINPTTTKPTQFQKKTFTLSRNTDSTTTGKPKQPVQPRIILFDSFNKNYAKWDYNNDGIRDRSHGYVVSDIIESQTGYSTQKIEVIDVLESEKKQKILNVLQLLLRANNDLTGTYVNLSIDWEGDSLMDNLMLQLADKGVKFYIAAGNKNINPSATKVLGEHSNIFIVAASGGIIGAPRQIHPTKQNISNPATDRVANGVLQPSISKSGIDLNRDGTIDFPNSILRNPYADLTGKSISKAYAHSLLSLMHRTRKIDHKAYLMGRDDTQGKVLSIKDLRKLGFIDESADKYIKRDYKITNESKVFVDLKPLALYLSSQGEYGDVVLYQNKQNSLIRFLPLYKPRPATSWAAPNALVEDINKDLGKH